MNLATKSRTKTAILSLSGLCLLASDALAATNRPLSSLPSVTAALGNDEILLNRRDGTNWTAIRGPITNTIHKNPMFYGTVTAAANIHLATSNGITAGGQGHYIIAQGANELTALYSGGTARQIIYQDKIRFDLPLHGDGIGITNVNPVGSLAYQLNTNVITDPVELNGVELSGGQAITATYDASGVADWGALRLGNAKLSGLAMTNTAKGSALTLGTVENATVDLSSSTIFSPTAAAYFRSTNSAARSRVIVRGSRFAGGMFGAGAFYTDTEWTGCVFDLYEPETLATCFDSDDFSTNLFSSCVFNYGGAAGSSIGVTLMAWSKSTFKNCRFTSTTPGTGEPKAILTEEDGASSEFYHCTFDLKGGLLMTAAGNGGTPIEEPGTHSFIDCYLVPYTNGVVIQNTNGAWYVRGGNLTPANFSSPGLVTWGNATNIVTTVPNAFAWQTNTAGPSLAHVAILAAQTAPDDVVVATLKIDYDGDATTDYEENLPTTDNSLVVVPLTTSRSFTFPLNHGSRWIVETNDSTAGVLLEVNAFWQIPR